MSQSCKGQLHLTQIWCPYVWIPTCFQVHHMGSRHDIWIKYHLKRSNHFLMFNIVHSNYSIRSDDSVYEFYVQLYECWHVKYLFFSAPGGNPSESIGRQGSRHIAQGLAGLALYQMAIPAGEGEVRCQALVHFLVAIRFHGRQQGRLLTWQGDTAKDAGLVLRFGGTCVADVNKQTMSENFCRKGSFPLRFAVPCQHRHHVYLLSGKAISDQVSLPHGSGTYIQK